MSLHFLGNLNRQALNLRQEAESGYQELGVGGGGEIPRALVKGSWCWRGADKKEPSSAMWARG